MPSLKPNVVHLASPDDMEQQFYDALRQGDVERMMSVWSDDDEIVCVHPGGPRVSGPAAIRASFDAMFSNGGVDAQLERVRRITAHSSAVHSVLERVQVRTSEGPKSAWVIATNVYQKTAQGWRMVAHHASAGSVKETEQAAEPAATLH